MIEVLLGALTGLLFLVGAVISGVLLIAVLIGLIFIYLIWKSFRREYKRLKTQKAFDDKFKKIASRSQD